MGSSFSSLNSSIDDISLVSSLIMSSLLKLTSLDFAFFAFYIGCYLMFFCSIKTFLENMIEDSSYSQWL